MLRWLSLEPWIRAWLPAWRDCLDEREAARADRFVHAIDRESFIAAHALKRRMLALETGLPPSALRFGRGSQGKPHLLGGDGQEGWRFNISHARGFVACVVAPSHDCGIDVETADRPIDRLDDMTSYFAPEEASAIGRASPQDKTDLFFRYWTLKEAFVKATGEGLYRPLASFSVEMNPLRVTAPPGTGALPKARLFQWHPQPHRFVALAVLCPPDQDLAVDAQAVGRTEV